MSIRTKLVGAFLVVALLVPLVSLLVSRVAAINESDGDEKPAASVALQLSQSQRAQQAAVLTFVNGGDVQARERYVSESLNFQDSITTLAEALTDDASTAELEGIAGQRERFGTVAEEAINARASMDRGLTDLRAADREIGQELNAIRDRIGDLAALPAAQRAQAADLLRAIIGMNQAANQQAALAAGYTIQQQEGVRQQMEASATAFTNALRLANAAAGSEDRAALGRTEAAFTGALLPSADALINAADAAAEARTTLAASSDAIVAGLGTLSEQAGDATIGGDSGIGGTGWITLAGTVFAFLLAAGLGVWFAGSITRPLRQLRNAAEQISTGDIDAVEITVHTNDEVGDLANAFRRMVASTRFLMMDKAEREAEDRDFMSTSISL
ncbi:MAG: HAMP domain-containing protein [Dehalococcoidia bacterium]